MISEINAYFQVSEIVILDINISDIQNNCFRYLKKNYFRYQVILDIKNNYIISENKHLFRISKTVILDIRHTYFRIIVLPFQKVNKVV